VLQVALATAAQLPDLDEDGAALLEALDAEGVQAAPVVWDSGADWAAYDLVVVRSTWDYDRRREQFLAWAASVPRLANPADVLAWNTDKTYLQALASAGVPVVETTWLVPGDVFTPPAGPYVVKPTVSAGARDTAAYDGGADATAHVQRLLAAGRPVMVQPYLPQVDVLGETSVLCFEGEVSHAASKSALLHVGAGVRNDIDSRAFVTPAEPSRAQVDLAKAALAVVGQPLLYARVDLVPGPDGPLLLELELTEPSLFLRHAEGATARFAAAVRRRADRSSPGGSVPRR